MKTRIAILLICCFSTSLSFAQKRKDTVSFEVGMERREAHIYDVSMRFSVGEGRSYVDVSMPTWSPGYYQVMDFAGKVDSFRAADESGRALDWEKVGNDTWRVSTDSVLSVRLDYSVLADRRFVATAFIDADRAFIKPAALFMYVRDQLSRPVSLSLHPPSHWTDVATGLSAVANERYSYEAPNFDILYDSPLLVGKLRALPAFFVEGIEHRFIGWGMKDFDEIGFMTDISKIVEASVALFDDIPYESYTFIGLGPGQGGIEQLNSTAISFTGEGLDGAGRNRTLRFIAHEYFHHYNVKRIRPIELGPFDYSRPNRTNMLWVAEGLTVYYEDRILKLAGLRSGHEILAGWASTISRHESNEGRFKQTLAQSSWNTWEDGPFGKPGETISYYVKGPIIGMLLDIEIRYATHNERSLDDVMRKLYHDYYKTAGRGFTADEVQEVCEEITGKKLENIFQYIYTLEEIDYPVFFAKAGLEIHFEDELDAERGTGRVARIVPSVTADERQRAVRNGIFGF